MYASLLLSLTASLAPATNTLLPWKEGPVELQSIGALTFGANGVLFVGDAEGASIYALELGETPHAGARELTVYDLNERIADLTGTTADKVAVHDVTVSPISGAAYLSASRMSDGAEQPLLLRVDDGDNIEVLDLSQAKHMHQPLNDAPAPGSDGRRNPRASSVTDIEFHDGTLLVAGLSNEEFASKLRMFDFPFDGKSRGTNVEIYHGAHGAWETRSPIRTFIPLDIDGKPHVLAGYTCTPLVSFPFEDLTQSDGKLRGRTVAELGSGNRPIDMLAYHKDGARFILIANTDRGLMKVSTEKLATQEGITQRVTKAGLSYETIDAGAHVVQLAGLDDERALALVEFEGNAALQPLTLP